VRYLLLIYEEPPATPPTEEEWAAIMPEYTAFGQWLRDTGQYLGGEALQSVTDATTVSVRDGRRIVTDGPFAETKEHLGGYYLIDAKDLDAAIDAAARVPGARFGKIEVRPIVEFG
jgi:hypothetical protein